MKKYQKCDKDRGGDITDKKVGHDGYRLIGVVCISLEFCQFYHYYFDDELECHDDEGNGNLKDDALYVVIPISLA